MEEKTIYYISEAAKKVQVESHVLRYWEEELELPIMRNEMGHRYYTDQDIIKLQEIKQLKEQGLQLKAIRTILLHMPEGIGSKAEGSGGENPYAEDLLRANLYLRPNSQAQTQTMGAEKEGAEDADNQLKERQENGMEEQVKAEPNRRTHHGEDGGSEPGEDKIRTDAEEIDIREPQRFIVALSKDEELQETHYDEADKSRKAARLQYLLQHMITEAVKSANRELCTDVKESILKELDYQFRMQEERDEERWKKEEEHYRKIDEMIRERHRPKERLGRGKKKSPAKDGPADL